MSLWGSKWEPDWLHELVMVVVQLFREGRWIIWTGSNLQGIGLGVRTGLILYMTTWAFDGKPVHGRGVSLLCNKRDLAYKAFWPWRHNCATENRLLEVHVLLHVLLYSLVLILLNLSFISFLCPSINYFYRNRKKILPTHRAARKLQVDGSTARQFRNLVAGWL